MDRVTGRGVSGMGQEAKGGDAFDARAATPPSGVGVGGGGWGEMASESPSESAPIMASRRNKRGANDDDDDVVGATIGTGWSASSRGGAHGDPAVDDMMMYTGDTDMDMGGATTTTTTTTTTIAAAAAAISGWPEGAGGERSENLPSVADAMMATSISDELLRVRGEPAADDEFSEIPDMLRGLARPSTFRVPQSSVLSRVRDFLPAMESANKSLEEALRERPASEFDIENVADDTEHIEMNLVLGLLEDKGSADAAAAAPVDDASLSGLMSGFMKDDSGGGPAPMVQEM